MKTAFLEEAGSNGDIYVYKMLTCSICMESITAVKGVNVNCGHAFHAECIVPWLQRDRRCPVCRHAPKSRKQEAGHLFLEPARLGLRHLHHFVGVRQPRLGRSAARPWPRSQASPRRPPFPPRAAPAGRLPWQRMQSSAPMAQQRQPLQQRQRIGRPRRQRGTRRCCVRSARESRTRSTQPSMSRSHVTCACTFAARGS